MQIERHIYNVRSARLRCVLQRLVILQPPSHQTSTVQADAAVPLRRIAKPISLSYRLSQGALHTATICCAISLWAWHLGDTAAVQPIAQKYGWFFNYLTFVALSLQLLHCAAALLADVLPSLPVSPLLVLYLYSLTVYKLSIQPDWPQVQWHRFVDDFGCALFGPVLFVTLSYYGTQCLPLNPLYGEDYQVVRTRLKTCGSLCKLTVFSAALQLYCCSHKLR